MVMKILLTNDYKYIKIGDLDIIIRLITPKNSWHRPLSSLEALAPLGKHLERLAKHHHYRVFTTLPRTFIWVLMWLAGITL
jgi:hypothetical protein